MTDRFAQVALPLPLFEPYTYSVPEILADRVVPGARVVVPVRRRELVGIVVGTGKTGEETGKTGEGGREAVTLSGAKGRNVALKDILAAPDAEPALSPELLRTAEWMAGYYGAPIGIALKAMLPAPMWGASRVTLRRNDAKTQRRLGGLAEEVLEWLERRGGVAAIEHPVGVPRRPLLPLVRADQLRLAALLGTESQRQTRLPAH